GELDWLSAAAELAGMDLELLELDIMEAGSNNQLRGFTQDGCSGKSRLWLVKQNMKLSMLLLAVTCRPFAAVLKDTSPACSEHGSFATVCIVLSFTSLPVRNISFVFAFCFPSFISRPLKL